MPRSSSRFPPPCGRSLCFISPTPFWFPHRIRRPGKNGRENIPTDDHAGAGALERRPMERYRIADLTLDVPAGTLHRAPSCSVFVSCGKHWGFGRRAPSRSWAAPSNSMLSISSLHAESAECSYWVRDYRRRRTLSAGRSHTQGRQGCTSCAAPGWDRRVSSLDPGRGYYGRPPRPRRSPRAPLLSRQGTCTV